MLLKESNIFDHGVWKRLKIISLWYGAAYLFFFICMQVAWNALVKRNLAMVWTMGEGDEFSQAIPGSGDNRKRGPIDERLSF